jgi:hypothetical protein
LLGRTSNEKYWIGLSGQKAQTPFEWSDKSKQTYTNFWKGSPANFNNKEFCVMMHKKPEEKTGNFGWSDVRCDSKHKSVCKKPSDKHLYKISEEKKSHPKAVQSCKKWGGNLASI